MMSFKNISIFDTTLRDGEQSLSNGLHPTDKPQVAEMLSNLGVDVIEVGFPTASSYEYDAIKHIASMSLKSTISVMTRARVSDIETSLESILPANKRRLNILFPVSDIHLSKKLLITREDALKKLDSIFSYASSLPAEIQFTAEDATRAEIDFLVECILIAVKYGVKIISLPDTLGIALPKTYSNLFRQLKSKASLGDDIVLSAHCHNDLGLATANTLAAISEGASQVEVTICGVGERAGNASLEQLVGCISLNGEVYSCSTNLNIQSLYQTSHKIASLMHYPIPAHSPIVGKNVYSTRAGIHQQGLLKSPSTYQGFDQLYFGAPPLQLVIGKHSGKASILSTLDQLGIDPNTIDLNQLVTLVKDKAITTQTGNITNEDLLNIYRSLTANTEQ